MPELPYKRASMYTWKKLIGKINTRCELCNTLTKNSNLFISIPDTFGGLDEDAIPIKLEYVLSRLKELNIPTCGYEFTYHNMVWIPIVLCPMFVVTKKTYNDKQKLKIREDYYILDNCINNNHKSEDKTHENIMVWISDNTIRNIKYNDMIENYWKMSDSIKSAYDSVYELFCKIRYKNNIIDMKSTYFKSHGTCVYKNLLYVPTGEFIVTFGKNKSNKFKIYIEYTEEKIFNFTLK
jgi:hypothetical protein